MKFNKRTLSIALAAVLLVGGGSAAVTQYLGQTSTTATVEEPLTVETQNTGQTGYLDSEQSATIKGGETATLDLKITNEADTDAPQFYRVLTISGPEDFGSVSNAPVEVTWTAEAYSGEEVSDSKDGLNNVNMLRNQGSVSPANYGDGAEVIEGDLVVCNAHADDGELESQGNSIDEKYEVTTDYFSETGDYQVDYSIRDSCPVNN